MHQAYHKSWQKCTRGAATPPPKKKKKKKKEMLKKICFGAECPLFHRHYKGGLFTI